MILLLAAVIALTDVPVFLNTVVNQVVRNAEMGLEYKVPVDWDITNELRRIVIAPTVYLLPNQQVPRGAIVVQMKAQNVELTPDSLDAKFLRDYTLSGNEAFDTYVPSFALLSSGSVMVGGKRGRVYRFTSEVDGEHGTSEEVRVPHEKRLFIFRVTALTYGFAQLKDSFDDFLESVRFVPIGSSAEPRRANSRKAAAVFKKPPVVMRQSSSKISSKSSSSRRAVRVKRK